MQQLNLQSWSKRNIMVSALLIISIVAIYNWFVVPHTRFLSAAQQYKSTMKSIEKKNQILKTGVALRQKELEKLSKKYESRKLAFFDIETAKSFLSNLQLTAEKNGCMVANLKLIPAKDVAVSNSKIDIREYQANLSLTGGYANIVKFLNTIQNKTARVWVDSIDVGMKHSESGYLSCEVTISIYTLKVKENADNVNDMQK